MKPKLFFFLSLVGLGALNIAVFYPSFYHIARADQLVYLIEVADLEKFSELLDYSISFTRTRLLFTGDRLYYRPLLYLALATEHYLFKYNFMFWQITGFVLHMFLVGTLLKLLNQIRPGRWMPTIFALFFSLLYISADMVIWHHINMYIFCFIMILLSLSYMISYMRDINPSASLWWMVACLILASLCNEFGLIACALIAVIMFITKKPGLSIKNHPLLLLIPIIIYAYLSLFDYLMKFPITQLLAYQSGIPDSLNPVNMITHFFLVLAIGLFAPLLPGLILLLPGERTFAMPYTYTGFLEYCIQYKWIVLANSILVIIIMIFFVLLFKYRKNISTQFHLRLLKERSHIPSTLLITSSLLALSYTFIFTVSRGGEDFYKYLNFSLYHFYPICLFLTIAAYCLMGVISKANFPQRKQLERFVLIILCVGSLLNASRVYELNMRGKQLFQGWGQYIQQIEKFVQAHKHEPDFSFAISNPGYMEKELKIRIGEPSEKREIRGYPSDYLFRKYITKKNPKYHFSFTVKGR